MTVKAEVMGGWFGTKATPIVLTCSVLASCTVLPRHPENGPPDNPIDILVVGDSYTAGNNATVDGDDGYYDSDKSPDDPRPIEQVRQKDTDPGLDRGCYRNHNNYGEQLYRLLGSTGAFINAACSGDVADNVTGTNGSEPQLDGFTQEQKNEVDLIALTIGGNDMEFGDIVAQCFVELTHSATGCADAFEYANSLLVQPGAGGNSLVQRKTSEVLTALAEDWPSARIVLVGYPLFYEDREFTLSDDNLEIQPGAVLEQGLNDLNDQQVSLVSTLNVDSPYPGRFGYLPLHRSDNKGFFDGHGVGGPEADWIRSVGTSTYRHEWMHPSAAGNAAIARELSGLAPAHQTAWEPILEIPDTYTTSLKLDESGDYLTYVGEYEDGIGLTRVGLQAGTSDTVELPQGAGSPYFGGEYAWIPAVSADGEVSAANHNGAFLYYWEIDYLEEIHPEFDGVPWEGAMAVLGLSDDGTVAAIESTGELNGMYGCHLFALDVPTNQLQLVDDFIGITNPPGGVCETQHGYTVSPDGSKIAATPYSSNGTTPLNVYDLETGSVTPIAAPDNMWIRQIEFSESGMAVRYATGVLGRLTISSYSPVTEIRTTFEPPAVLGSTAVATNSAAFAVATHEDLDLSDASSEEQSDDLYVFAGPDDDPQRVTSDSTSVYQAVYAFDISDSGEFLALSEGYDWLGSGCGSCYAHQGIRVLRVTA